MVIVHFQPTKRYLQDDFPKVIYRKFNKKLKKIRAIIKIILSCWIWFTRTIKKLTLYNNLNILKKIIIIWHKRGSLDLTFQLCQYTFWLVWGQSHKRTHIHKTHRFGETMMFDHGVKKDFYNQRGKSKCFIESPQILMINKEIHFHKRHRSRLHSLHSYWQAHRHSVIRAECENVVMQLNQEMADKYGEAFSTELGQCCARKACSCLCRRDIIIRHQRIHIWCYLRIKKAQGAISCGHTKV